MPFTEYSRLRHGRLPVSHVFEAYATVSHATVILVKRRLPVNTTPELRQGVITSDR